MTDLVPMVTVTAGMKDATTSAAAGNGTAEFHMPGEVVDSSGDALGPQTIPATIVNGAFTTVNGVSAASAKLIATDTVGSVPVGWLWTITVSTDQWNQRFRAPVPASPSTATLGQLWKNSPDNPANQ